MGFFHPNTDVSWLLTARLGANSRHDNEFDGQTAAGSEPVDNCVDHFITRCLITDIQIVIHQTRAYVYVTAGRDFWIQNDNHHELAKMFERNVEVTSPRHVRCCYCGLTHCSWGATTVTYYEYNGPSV